MNKKLLKAALLVAVVAVAGLGVHKAQAKKTTLSDIMLANVEAISGDESIKDWWERCDYVCTPVTCKCLFYSYQSKVAERVEDGTGEVPHTWSCTGCGDCGWTMN